MRRLLPAALAPAARSLVPLLLTVSTAQLGVACAEFPSADSSTAVAAVEHEIATARTRQKLHEMPAYSRGFTDQGKSDSASNFRFANPQYFAITDTPQVKGFRPMVEWEPMTSTMIALADYIPGGGQLEDYFIDILNAAGGVSELWIIYDQASTKSKFETRLKKDGPPLDKIKWYQMPVDAMWMIDFGPLPLVDDTAKSQSILDFVYYPERVNDDATSTRIGQVMGAATYRMPHGFEGGNFQADGAEHCFTTQRAIQANGAKEADFTATLKSYAGCENVTYLYDVSDDGTGHIDMLFKMGPDHKALVVEYPENMEKDLPTALQKNVAENRKRMNDNAAKLEALVYKDASKIKVFRLVMPGYKNIDFGGGQKEWIPHTYVNSTLVNKRNLWPVYSYTDWAASKGVAQGQWEAFLPDYTHMAIISDESAAASGAIHCVTRTFPAVPFAKWIPDGKCETGKCAPPAEFATTGNVSECKDEKTCFGPKWLCVCQDCDSGCKPPVACGDIKEVGCCTGDELSYCDQGSLVKQNCPASTCGWTANPGYYDCNTDGSTDPSGKAPKICGEKPCVPACSGTKCGDNGCGGTCGTCGAGETCDAGTCKTPPPLCTTDECAEGDKGCDGSGVPWVCEKADGCFKKKPAAACKAGETCDKGICAAGGTTGGGTADASGGGATGSADATSADAAGGGAKSSSGGSASGCASGTTRRGAPALLLLLAAVALGLARRRAPAR